MSDNSSVVSRVEGRGIPVRGNDIDTDRIIPARYLRNITFEGLGEFAFEDDRKSGDHPFDDSKFQGASVLIANANFGCGSSREHAPQSLMRWGINALVSESFAEIFQGNCTAMGVPCVTLDADSIQKIMGIIEENPTELLDLDLVKRTLTVGEHTFQINIPDGNRVQLLEGAWDATGMLLEGASEVRKVANSLPYVSGY
jgi:3-isopropylmalate/(R)-2-methylmalate dehydratase small subunit